MKWRFPKLKYNAFITLTVESQMVNGKLVWSIVSMYMNSFSK